MKASINGKFIGCSICNTINVKVSFNESGDRIYTCTKCGIVLLIRKGSTTTYVDIHTSGI